MSNNKQYQSILWFMMSFMFVAVLLLSGLLTPSISQAELPNRDTPIPAPSNNDGDDDDDGDSSPQLSYIELFASSAPAGAWSAVQWQDPQGGWHDVEGWRGVLGSGGYQRWTVEAKDFGKGPFRWQVRHGGPKGTPLSTSEFFTLPAEANETLQIQASAGE